jgi:long-subunit acyl-CoA synthetase (AMP-forming)
MNELLAALRYRAETSGASLAFHDGLTRLDYAGLAGRVAGVAEDIRSLNSPSVIGVLGGNRVETVIGQLAGWHTGKIVVPLPPFLPAGQLRHIAADAGIAHILATPEQTDTAKRLAIPFTPISARMANWEAPASSGAGQIIYSSGTTGHPKGVLLQSDQLTWSGRALAGAIGANQDDVYLSVLPLAFLLETISAIVIPILVGASARLEPVLAASFGEVSGGTLATVVALRRPTCMVLVPQLLANWIRRLSGDVGTAPDSLRFVAVGGASLAPALAEKAWRRGIPVYEGYGLSECGSVVALNRPEGRKAGTVGKPLPGLDVRIVDEEIVVGGPSVMDRYVQGKPAGGSWRTGDVGEIDGDGYLTVRGRRDNVLVTPLGRNISPEWVEALLDADPRIACSIVIHCEGPYLTALLVPSARGEEWFDRASHEDIAVLISACCAEAPSYAIPRHSVVVLTNELSAQGLLTADGRIRRRPVLDEYADLLARAGTSPVKELAK